MSKRNEVFNRIKKYIEDTADSVIYKVDPTDEVEEVVVTLTDTSCVSYHLEEKEIILYNTRDNALDSILKVKEDSSNVFILSNFVGMLVHEEDYKELVGSCGGRESTVDDTKEYESQYIKELAHRNNISIEEVKENYVSIIEDEFNRFLNNHNKDFKSNVVATYVDNLIDKTERETRERTENKMYRKIESAIEELKGQTSHVS